MNIRNMSARGGSASGGKIISKSLIFALFISLLVGFATPALAYYPNLTISGSGSNVSVSINGALSNSQIQLSYTQPGSALPTTINNFGVTDYSGNFNTYVSDSAYGLN
ncbi:MAG TPA: hypothetical protein VE973_02640, partial [Candidatus Limnocylindria bacterium]|nr:hypothetical protein [Candidatus Limnocylindria bacterium]